jgi:hypothetical protein
MKKMPETLTGVAVTALLAVVWYVGDMFRPITEQSPLRHRSGSPADSGQHSSALALEGHGEFLLRLPM